MTKLDYFVPTWEYHLHSTSGMNGPEAMQVLLNDLGREGWECFHVTASNLWFKRPLPGG